MKNQYRLSLLALAAVLTFSGCEKREEIHPTTNYSCQGPLSPTNPDLRLAAGFPEGFEGGTKGSYASASVTFGSGSWTLNEALVGNTTSDRKTGNQSLRVRDLGTVRMNFNAPNGATTVTVSHAKYGTDANSTWELWYSQNSGSSWVKSGSTITTSSTTLATATFTLNLTGSIRFEIRKTSGTGLRINFDDFTVNEADGTGGTGGTTGGPATRDDNMGMGNPSNATTSTSNTTNYLMVKNEYTHSYNSVKGIPNWVSWHLSTAWKGAAPRSTSFTQDATLPTGWYRVSTNDYTNSGFDRGHMCPSDDRDYSSAENAMTFKMSNIIPQAPLNNQGPWAALETYCRTLITQGNECYIIAGPQGSGGTGSLGGVTTTLAAGKVSVPAWTWKIVVVLPNGTSDAGRVTTSTRVIAIKMPNTQAANTQNWGYYRTSVDQLEALTGYDFLSAVNATVQSTIEATVDNGPVN
jgi:endonuclease G